MAVATNKNTVQKRWALADVTQGDVTNKAEIWITHTSTVKDVGLPTETTEHWWEAEVNIARVKLVVVASAGKTEFDAALNVLRQAIVDARAALDTM